MTPAAPGRTARGRTLPCKRCPSTQTAADLLLARPRRRQRMGTHTSREQLQGRRQQTEGNGGVGARQRCRNSRLRRALHCHHHPTSNSWVGLAGGEGSSGELSCGSRGGGRRRCSHGEAGRKLQLPLRRVVNRRSRYMLRRRMERGRRGDAGSGCSGGRGRRSGEIRPAAALARPRSPWSHGALVPSSVDMFAPNYTCRMLQP